MKTPRTYLLKAILYFSLILFVVYLLMLLASYFGCCSGISTAFYLNVVWVLLGIGALVFAFCFYYKCFMKRGENTKP